MAAKEVSARKNSLFTKKHPLIDRRIFLQMLAVMPIAACETSPALTENFEQLSILTRGFPDTPIERQYITDLPYASIMAKIGRGPRSLMVLGRYINDDLHWIGSDKTTIATKNYGRLTQTAGLPENLDAVGFYGVDPLKNALEIINRNHSLSFQRWHDYRHLQKFSTLINSTFHPEKTEKITILERTYETVCVREENRCPSLKWNFTNYFWVEKDGFIRKSEQYYAPDAPKIEIQITKKAA